MLVQRTEHDKETEAEWIATLDRLLSRTDAALDEYVDADNKLADVLEYQPGANSGLLQFRRLQTVDKAVQMANPDGSLFRTPLAHAWLNSHGKRDPFSGYWYVDPHLYWRIFDASRQAPWAEDVAWTAVRIDIPRDECSGTCMLRVVVRQPLQYWRRLPNGKHIAEVLTMGSEEAQAAASEACDGSDSPSDYRPLQAQIRASLLPVRSPEKLKILKALDEVSRKCAK